MEWIITVVVELHSGTSLKIDDTVTYRLGGNEHTGVIQSFMPGNKADGPGVIIKTQLSDFVKKEVEHSVFAKNITHKAGIEIVW